MDCSKFYEKIDELREKKLSRWEWISMRLHWLICGDCRRYLAQYLKTIAIAHGLAAAELPAAKLADPIVEQIAREMTQAVRSGDAPQDPAFDPASDREEDSDQPGSEGPQLT